MPLTMTNQLRKRKTNNQPNSSLLKTAFGEKKKKSSNKIRLKIRTLRRKPLIKTALVMFTYVKKMYYE